MAQETLTARLMYHSARCAVCPWVAVFAAVALSFGVQARPNMSGTNQLDIVPATPPQIERAAPANTPIDMVTPATPRIVLPAQSGGAGIQAAPVANDRITAGEPDRQAVRRELLRLTQQAGTPRNFGATNASARAAWQLGLIYLHGAGVRRDPALAATWFQRAAKFGREPWAYAGLAWCAIDGCEGPPNPATADRAIAQLRGSHPARADFLNWVLQARQAPLQVAQPGAGMQSPKLELPHRALLERAANANDTQAMVELGIDAASHERFDQAEQWLKKAAPYSAAARADLQELKLRAGSMNQGSRPATASPGAAEALALARRYHRGEGVPANFSEAIRYYQLAQARGSIDARRMLALIYARPAPGGGILPGWMQQLAYVDPATTVPTVGVTGNTHMLQRDPTPLFDLMPAFWRQQMSLVGR